MFTILSCVVRLHRLKCLSRTGVKGWQKIRRFWVEAWVFKCQSPLGQHGTEQEQVTTERGSSGGYFAAVLKAPWPINRLFEFPPRRACHVSIREGLFLLPVRLLAAGGSHTSHLATYCCLVPGRLPCIVYVCAQICIYVCICVSKCTLWISCF